MFQIPAFMPLRDLEKSLGNSMKTAYTVATYYNNKTKGMSFSSFLQSLEEIFLNLRLVMTELILYGHIFPHIDYKKSECNKAEVFKELNQTETLSLFYTFLEFCYLDSCSVNKITPAAKRSLQHILKRSEGSEIVVYDIETALTYTAAEAINFIYGRINAEIDRYYTRSNSIPDLAYKELMEAYSYEKEQIYSYFLQLQDIVKSPNKAVSFTYIKKYHVVNTTLPMYRIFGVQHSGMIAYILASSILTIITHYKETHPWPATMSR